MRLCLSPGRNAWHLEGFAGNAKAPINRQTYRVTALALDGAGLTVARVVGRDEHGAEQLAEPIQLPGSYVRDRVTLAYACTVHASHGRTVERNYGVVAPGTDAAAGYVLSTRGRDGNFLFVDTRRVADTAEIGETQKVALRTAAEVLADVIRPPDVERDRSALTEAEQAADRARSTAMHVDPLIEVIGDVTHLELMPLGFVVHCGFRGTHRGINTAVGMQLSRQRHGVGPPDLR
jgi:hypothetical protein